jgi:uncharacterized protein (DUF488 family)
MDVFTVGHGTRTLDNLIETLVAAQIHVLVDVRRYPMSRRHPQFNRKNLEAALPRTDIAYVFKGDELGGRRSPSKNSRHTGVRNDSFRGYADHMDTAEFRAALSDVEEMVRHGQHIAVMCAETHWTQCHRRFIADAFSVDGFNVVHLITPEKREPHKSIPEMRVDHAGKPLYDGGEQPSLFARVRVP